MATSRTRFFSLISYAPRDFILDVCKKKSLYYAFILHDRDIDNDGVIVTPHYHILLRTANAHEPSAVCKWFRGSHGQNTFCEEVYSTNVYDYLTHEGFEDKFQYSKDDIVSNCLDKFNEVCELEHLNVVQLLDDINAKKSLRYMALHYGRDFILNRKKYTDYASLMLWEETTAKRLIPLSEEESAVVARANGAQLHPFDEYEQFGCDSLLPKK